MKAKLGLVLTLMTLFTVNAFGCSCGSWDAQSIMTHADGVYVAIPTEDSRPIFRRLPPRTGMLGKIAKTKMKIVKTYKGSTTEFLNVFHEPQRGTSCEFNYSASAGVFVVITYKVKGLQVTDACSTAQISPNNSMVTNFLLQL